MVKIAGEERQAVFRGGERHSSFLPDPSRIWMIFRRRLWVFLLVAVLVFSAIAVAVALTTPRYAATASVLVQPREPTTVQIDGQKSVTAPDTNVVDTAVQLINAAPVALAVVRELKLDRDPVFVKPEALAGQPARPVANGMTAAERIAVATLLQRASARRVGQTYVIDITANSSDPESAMTLANAMARNYIELQGERRTGDTAAFAAGAERRVAELGRDAVQADTAVRRYMIANNLMSANGTTMAEQEVSSLNQQIAEARAKLAEEQGKLAAARAQVRQGGGGADVGAVLASETIRQLREQESQGSAELARLQARYGDLHPEVIKIRSQVEDTRAQLRDERRRILSGLEANVRVAASGLGSLLASQSRSRGALAANNAAQVGLLELERKAEAAKAIYNAYLKRAQEATAQTALPAADASISSQARMPSSPYWPNYRLAAVAGLLMALIAGLAAVGVAEYLDNTVSTREDVERKLQVPYAGAVPELASLVKGGEPPNLYVISHPFSLFVEALRNLGAFLLLNNNESSRVIAITSSLPREGKTTLSVCLARALAMAKKRVVLIDGDLRRHSVSDLLVRDSTERLLAVLDGTMPLEQALVKDEHTNLFILPTAGLHSGKLTLEREQVAALYAVLKREFEVVIVDTAPVLGLSETRILAREADVTLLVTRWRKSSIKAASASIDVLEQSEANLAGAVLNAVDTRKYASTGEGDLYGYHKKFTGYYVN